MSALAFDLLVAAVPFGVLLVGSWRLVWPRWKLVGKGVAYFSLVAVGATWLGHWVLPLAWLHQGVGLAGHVWFSRRHGFTWYAVEDPERYVALSKAMVGWEPLEPEPGAARGGASDAPRLYGVELVEPRMMQQEGEPPARIEWMVDWEPPERPSSWPDLPGDDEA